LTQTEASRTEPLRTGNEGHALITGGAGFIGCNVAQRLLEAGEQVVLLDNLSRAGVERNVEWLRATYGDRVRLENADVRDAATVQRLVSSANQVFHFAAQVAVTTSLVEPIHDFEVNARGTLNVLEAIRKSSRRPPLVFTSTNKVYGALPDLEMVREGRRYAPALADVKLAGISERRALDFHSPYGCSKGAADQYVIDYARTFDMPATVFRMSCIYGPRQFGTEDQGWVAHFLIRALQGQTITIYGDGHQVRDLLFVEDLVDAMLLARDNIDAAKGRAFNIGGGPSNAVSLLELLDQLERLCGGTLGVRYEDWRPGDQLYYVSDCREFARLTGWKPRMGVEAGLARLQGWLKTWLRKSTSPALRPETLAATSRGDAA
jgi:CDP-paratose 2-epimerase